jgi:hypothetical protein
MLFYGVSCIMKLYIFAYTTHIAFYNFSMGKYIKLHVQIFLKLNIWMFETCRRQYN